MNKDEIKIRGRAILAPIVSGLATIGMTPTLVSIVGLAVSIYAAFLVANSELFMGAVWLLVAGLCDVLDGQLARHRGMESRFGAFIDSTLDRVSEFAVLGAIVLYFLDRIDGYTTFDIVVVLAVLGGSLLTSYTRARLEGLGYSCRVGLLERPERFALLLLGLLLGGRVLTPVLFVLAVGAWITVIQRVYHGKKMADADVVSDSTQ